MQYTSLNQSFCFHISNCLFKINFIYLVSIFNFSVFYPASSRENSNTIIKILAFHHTLSVFLIPGLSIISIYSFQYHFPLDIQFGDERDRIYISGAHVFCLRKRRRRNIEHEITIKRGGGRRERFHFA